MGDTLFSAGGRPGDNAQSLASSPRERQGQCVMFTVAKDCWIYVAIGQFKHPAAVLQADYTQLSMGRMYGARPRTC
jgi:hypothetical protein